MQARLLDSAHSGKVSALFGGDGSALKNRLRAVAHRRYRLPVQYLCMTTHAAPDVSPVHHVPKGFSDHFALGFTKLLRLLADTFFAKRYGHRAIVLETVAAVPGMVGGTIQHLTSLRRMVDDDGWIRTLMEEAENERMHLMTFIQIASPTTFERLVVLLAQWIFYVGFFLLYLVSSRTAHRVVGYFEEEAVLSYTLYLKELDEGRAPNVPAPAIARHYWELPDDATLLVLDWHGPHREERATVAGADQQRAAGSQ